MCSSDLERWVKGRKMLYRGATDIEVAAGLGILLEEWQEVRKICSGPPLELKDQATPTDPLEPSEVNFAAIYVEQAESAIQKLSGELQDYLGQIELYLNGNGSRVPKAAVNAILSAAGCAATDWSTMDLDLVEGWTDLGDDRFQGSLF